MAKISPELKLDEADIDALLRTETRLRIATLGPGTDINLTPMTFGSAGGKIYIYARGQKVANLRRSATATILIQARRGDQMAMLAKAMTPTTASANR